MVQRIPIARAFHSMEGHVQSVANAKRSKLLSLSCVGWSGGRLECVVLLSMMRQRVRIMAWRRRSSPSLRISQSRVTGGHSRFKTGEKLWKVSCSPC